MGRMPHCPACDCLLLPPQTHLLRFDCPGCGTTLRPRRNRAYRWLRVAACYGAGITAARLHGWDWSFIVFVVSLYALPAAFLFDSIVLNFVSAQQFETLPGNFQMLNLSVPRRDELQL